VLSPTGAKATSTIALRGRKGLEGLAVRDLRNCSSFPRVSYQLLQRQHESFLVLKFFSVPEGLQSACGQFNSRQTSGTGRCCGYSAREVCH
jgi:hypothetical protein